jgi:uncharacterized integral membrane protein (TIGR00697 family)
MTTVVPKKTSGQRCTEAGFRYIGVLTALNVTFLLVSDFTGARIIGIYGVGVSITVLYFPFTYLIGDLLTEVYGYARARRVIWISLACSLVGSTVAAAQLAIPPAPFFATDPAFVAVFAPGVGVAIAGAVAFFTGDIANSYVLAKMKVNDEGRRLWLRLVLSTIAGEVVNTALFYGIALYRVLPHGLLWRAAALACAIKILVEIALLPITYIAVRFLKRAEDIDYFDDQTDFNPFVVR